MKQYLVKTDQINKSGYYPATNQKNYTDDVSTFLYKLKFNFYILLNINDKYFYIINYDDINKKKEEYRKIIKSHSKEISFHIRTNFDSYKMYILNIYDYIETLFKDSNGNIITSYRRKPNLDIKNIINDKISYHWKIPLNLTATFNDFKILLSIILTKNLNNSIHILNNTSNINNIVNSFISKSENTYLRLTPAYITQLKTILKFYNEDNINEIKSDLYNYDDVNKVNDLIKILRKKRNINNLNVTVKGVKFSISNFNNFASFGKQLKKEMALSYLKSINEIDTLYIKLSRALF
jgi:hypothetical protein